MIMFWERARIRNRLRRCHGIDRGSDDGAKRGEKRKERKRGRARRNKTRTRKASVSQPDGPRVSSKERIRRDGIRGRRIGGC